MRKVASMIMTQLILFIDRLTRENRQSVIIFDDSLFSCNRSKKVELLAREFDYTSQKFCKRFRMLTIGWSDGNTFMPISFCLLNSPMIKMCSARRIKEPLPISHES
ncbi:hypothetical protein [Tepidanaerobacter acetatoxydans]|uniref:hypothetical protein n=1 Tax=Tepidanaerobacter acetatoxydans TaxID=499229 RepID=UPI0002A673D3|nr:hypothetical protein [Tepidanaerobacter acetatoxydans]